MLDKQATIPYNRHMTEITYESYIECLRQIVENYDKAVAKQQAKLLINKQQLEMISNYMSHDGIKAHYIVFDELEN